MADDRPDRVRPWIEPPPNRERILEGLTSPVAPRSYEDRSAGRPLPTEVRRNTTRTPRGIAPSVGRSYQDRSGTPDRLARDRHAATQYRSDITGARERLEQENRSDRRSFDRLQRLRREETRMRR